MKAILTDIEGTTSSISFVKDVLFPYARRALPGFVREHGQQPEVRRWLDSVAAELGGACQDEVVTEALQGWIDEDRKHTALKALQGMIWADGYGSGAFHSHFYPDAVEAMRRWHEAGIPIHVYSSGSVPAQKMLFGHSTHGDLTGLVSGWYDTTTGPKREAESYRKIAAEIGLPAGEILFLSDVVAELDAARDAGLATTLLDRREDYPTARSQAEWNGHRRAESFADLPSSRT